MTELAKALLAAQKSLPEIHKDSKAEVVSKKTGARFSYTYLSLPALLEAVLPILNTNGLAFSQMPTATENGQVLRTTLFHESGEVLVGDTPLILSGELTPQTWGGAVTYARRYALTALLGIAADEDDDGAAASRPKVSQQKNKAVAQPANGIDQLTSSLAEIDTLVTALASAKSNDKADWIKSIDEGAGDSWRSDVDAAALVLARVRRWADQAGVGVSK